MLSFEANNREMKAPFITTLLLTISLVTAGQPSKKDLARWNKQAQDVTIIRDKWGIPHVYGKTDADAVFGLMYVQCEQSFERVELNHLEIVTWRACSCQRSISF